ncbi:hypothetical protein NVS89_16185 [Ancylobacter sp. MQZ15Z-1]|uniref:Uncharacterized protein n=1 Tax=Ancylobacter mangrovi TaxID=2972472 RepID=A0A9X2T4X3_9HYPH|nr:hypothetical protein [Ancylobacter mangrovi]MCS0496641.1 hypothetical protein [Ancylobacter mangrovi]
MTGLRSFLPTVTVGAALAPLLSVLGVVGLPAPSAQAAVVYCTGPGVPAGCVVRATPLAGPNPVARAAVYCTRPGYPVGCVPGPAAAPAARAVVRPGPGVNLGGPVNRPGLR